MYKVELYTSNRKISPIKKYLDSCQPSLRVKILRQFKYVEMYGLSSSIPNVKKLTNTPFWELRILGRDNIRIICVPKTRTRVVVLHIFRKKSQKTPPKELNIALKRNHSN